MAAFNGVIKLPEVWQRVVNKEGITDYNYQINFFYLSNFE